jgi:hypothetical protein
MASETQARPAVPARTLIGHLSEYQRLLTVLDAQPGTVVVAADPLSGASVVVRSVGRDRPGSGHGLAERLEELGSVAGWG